MLLTWQYLSVRSGSVSPAEWLHSAVLALVRAILSNSVRSGGRMRENFEVDCYPKCYPRVGNGRNQVGDGMV